jgi:hypothetical protein
MFDRSTEHHFYVDEATKRSTWVHPYDDPEYLRSLPDTHPANPNSSEAQAVRKHAEEEERLARKANEDRSSVSGAKIADKSTGTGGKEKSWFQKKKDNLLGTKEERAQYKEAKRKARAEQDKREQEAYAAYVKRRNELIQKRLNDPSIRWFFYLFHLHD